MCPRKSQAALAAEPFRPRTARRLAPRKGTRKDVAAVFREVVAAAPAEHFAPGDDLLIEQYAQAVVWARQADAALAKEGAVLKPARGGRAQVNPWVAVLEKAHRASAALATKLRLAPQSRLDPKTAGRRAGGPPPSAYERMTEED